jgi:hypothetical protein
VVGELARPGDSVSFEHRNICSGQGDPSPIDHWGGARLKFASRLGIGRRADNPAPETKITLQKLQPHLVQNREPRKGKAHMNRLTLLSEMTKAVRKPTCRPTFYPPGRPPNLAPGMSARCSKQEKARQISQERNYKLTTLGLFKNRWTAAGQTRLTTEEVVLYSRHEQNNTPLTEGVSLMLTRQAQNALVAWAAIGPIIIQASFKTSNTKVGPKVI